MKRPFIFIAIFVALFIAAGLLVRQQGEVDSSAGSRDKHLSPKTPRPPSVGVPSSTDAEQPYPSELQHRLSEEKPKWLNIAPAIRLQELDQSLAGTLKIEPPQGAVSSSRSIITLGSSTVDFTHPKEIVFVSVSPSGKKLLLHDTSENGYGFTIFKVENNKLVPASSPIPVLNYDDEQRWWINRWYWGSETELIGVCAVEDSRAENIVATRLYGYDLNSHTLRALDLPAPVGNYAEFQVVGVDWVQRVLKVSAVPEHPVGSSDKEFLLKY